MPRHPVVVNRGRLVAFEGLDGSGKSTQVARLATRLERSGVDVVVTGEPTDGPVGRRIRTMLRTGEVVSPELELTWFTQDRRTHVAEVIEPALAAGQVVITDRYYLSTVAYQGAHGLDSSRVLADCEAEFPAPDLVLLLVLDPAEGVARVKARGGSSDPEFEREEFLARVADVFAGLELDVVERIDASESPDAVEAEIGRRVKDRLGLS